MTTRQQTAEGVKRTAVGRLAWQTAQRDDQKVAQAVHQGEELDAIYNLDEAGLLDEFYHFLELIGFLRLIGALELSTVERVLIPVVQFVLGIFHVAELAVLGGLRIKSLPQELGSSQAILARYGLRPSEVEPREKQHHPD